MIHVGVSIFFVSQKLIEKNHDIKDNGVKLCVQKRLIIQGEDASNSSRSSKRVVVGACESEGVTLYLSPSVMMGGCR